MLNSLRVRSLIISLGFLALMGCHRPPESAFLNRGGPESLLDVSSEVVNLSVAGAKEVGELAQWVRRDPPTRAELYCATNDLRCADARKALELNGIPTNVVGSGDHTVTLVYERILARDCNSRFIDNSPNPYNAPSPAFGCAVAANIVQHVSDKQEFVSPPLSGNALAVGAVSSFNRAYAPRTVKNPNGYDINDSLVSKARSQ